MQLQMSDGEIYRSWKGAKNPREQIHILAQLNACDSKDISDAIARHRVKVEAQDELLSNMASTKRTRVVYSEDCIALIKDCIARGLPWQYAKSHIEKNGFEAGLSFQTTYDNMRRKYGSNLSAKTGENAVQIKKDEPAQFAHVKNMTRPVVDSVSAYKDPTVSSQKSEQKPDRDSSVWEKKAEEIKQKKAEQEKKEAERARKRAERAERAKKRAEAEEAKRKSAKPVDTATQKPVESDSSKEALNHEESIKKAEDFVKAFVEDKSYDVVTSAEDANKLLDTVVPELEERLSVAEGVASAKVFPKLEEEIDEEEVTESAELEQQGSITEEDIKAETKPAEQLSSTGKEENSRGIDTQVADLHIKTNELEMKARISMIEAEINMYKSKIFALEELKKGYEAIICRNT